jgi:Flp pilus assembly protein TadD
MHNNLGVEYYRRGNVEEARKEFRKSTELAPMWDINWNNLGATYNYAGDLKTAEECYLRAMQHGTYFMAYENYAAVLVRQGRIVEAKKFISERALPMFPASQELLSLAREIQDK